MSTAVMMGRIRKASPRSRARIAGVFYLLTFVTGGFALIAGNTPRGVAAGLIAGVCYIAVTLLLYNLLKPVSRSLSLLAALVSLLGIAFGPVSGVLHLTFPNPLVFFGFYCLLIGYLIFHSTFLPRILGALMAFAGLGWLIFLSPPLATYLSPYVFGPGLIGEGALTLWLLVMGVNAQRWNEHASTPTGPA